MTAKDGEAGGDAHALAAQLALAQGRLRELDHRVKNDLQLIASVFVLQMRHLGEGPERELVAGALGRVSAVSAVQRRLDVGGDPTHVEVSGVIRDLAEEATASRRDVEVALELSPLTLAARQAAPLALIANELIRNGVKHAFPARAGTMQIGLWSADGTVRFSVRDNGVGAPSGIDQARGFGLTLAGLLARQLRGELEIDGGHPGLRAVVRFPQVT